MIGIVAGKRTPFTDLPVDYQQNVQIKLEKEQNLGKSPARFIIHQDKFVPQSVPTKLTAKLIPLSLHLAVLAYHRKSFENLKLLNAFLMWRLALQNKSTKSRPATIPSVASQYVIDAQQKWTTPKKRRLEGSDASYVGQQSSACNQPYTPVASAKRSSLSLSPTQSTPFAGFGHVNTPESEPKIAMNSKERGSLLERLALLEQEVQHVKLATSQTHPKSSIDMSTYQDDRQSYRHRLHRDSPREESVYAAEDEASHASGPSAARINKEPPARDTDPQRTAQVPYEGMRNEVSLRSTTLLTEVTSYDVELQQSAPGKDMSRRQFLHTDEIDHESSIPRQQPMQPVASTATVTAGAAMQSWRTGFHYWMLKKMYTQTIHNDGAVWRDIYHESSPSNVSTSAIKRDQLVDTLAVALSPLGEQGRSLNSPVPLSSLTLVQTKLSSWKTKYAHR
jgi:hypothetical protein